MRSTYRNLFLIILYSLLFLAAGVAVSLRLFSANSRRLARHEHLQFLCLAWQEEALVTYKALVAEWNRLHPEMAVDYIQGTWGSVHDYLITGFETGDVPDIIHYESSAVIDFAVRGYLEDLASLISADLRSDIQPVAWASVQRSNGAISGVPILLESLIILYNKELFARAGIMVPTMEAPWSWEEMAEAAKKLTVDRDGDGITDQWGAGMGLRNCANMILNLTIGFGGSFFRSESGHYVVRVEEEETRLLHLLMKMMYADSSMTTAGLGQSGPAMIPGFSAGRYAMVVNIGAWARQQLVANAPPGLAWGVLPPLKAASQQIGTSSQTLSIPRLSSRKSEAMAFIEFLSSRDNMARIAASDWMVPARASCLGMPHFQSREDGWEMAAESANYLTTGPWIGAPGYIEWKSRVANPILQELFANRMTVDEAARRIEIESNLVLERYQTRDERW